MHPVTLTIVGSFWDSQIYSGELFLFTDEGSIQIIDWRQAVDSLADRNPKVQTALRVAFLDGDLFYNPKVRKILLDPEIQTPIRTQLENLSSIILEMDDLSYARKKIFDSPFDFLPTDTEIYYSTIFAAGDEGLYSSPSYINKVKARRHHDGPIFQVKASDRCTALAAAAGDDGLMEFRYSRKTDDGSVGERKRIAPQSCKACDWAFQSVMGWNNDSAFLASFREEKNPTGSGVLRIPGRIFDIGELFNDNDLFNERESYQEGTVSWGAREKLYRLGIDGIDVIDYRAHDQQTDRFGRVNENVFDKRQERIVTSFSPSDVVATGTAPFGTVIEFVDKILVLASNGDIIPFLGEPVHWRIFPRAEYYSNQLHILYEDHVKVISFAHDYFVDQKSKLLGFSKKVSDNLSDSW